MDIDAFGNPVLAVEDYKIITYRVCNGNCCYSVCNSMAKQIYE